MLIRVVQTLQAIIQVHVGVKPAPRELSKLERLNSDPESRRLWKRFQQMVVLPEKDQRAVVRLINSLVGSKTQDRATA